MLSVFNCLPLFVIYPPKLVKSMLTNNGSNLFLYLQLFMTSTLIMLKLKREIKGKKTTHAFY